MPETRAGARARAARLGIPKGNVVRASTGGHFIAPRGVTSAKGRHAYAECRAGGGAKGTCAAVAHKVHARHSR